MILVRLPDGSVFRCEVAGTQAARRIGLSNRVGLAQNCGMLFIHPRTGFHPFWMKDTRFPLDILWMDRAGCLVEVVEDAQPLSFDTLGGHVRSAYALELPAGSARNVRIGDRIRF
jgi:uncharacterized protein